LQGHAFKRIEGGDSSRDDLVLGVVLTGLPPMEVMRSRLEYGSGHMPPVTRLIWLRPDGFEFLAQLGGEVRHVRMVGGKAQIASVATDARGIAASSTSAYILRGHSPSTVSWFRKGFSPGVQVTKVSLQQDCDGLYAGSEDGQILTWDHAIEDPTFKQNLRLVDLVSEADRDLAPPDGVVLRVLPVRGSVPVVATLWKNGRERPDGTRLTRFVAWDYLTRKQTLLHENVEGYEIQCMALPCVYE